MLKNYGYFNEELGSFTLTEFPKVGNYEYIYKICKRDKKSKKIAYFTY